MICHTVSCVRLYTKRHGTGAALNKDGGIGAAMASMRAAVQLDAV